MFLDTFANLRKLFGIRKNIATKTRRDIIRKLSWWKTVARDAIETFRHKLFVYLSSVDNSDKKNFENRLPR